MPAISFIVFEDKILNGTKRMTIRRLWKRSPKIGDKLYLYSHMRTKKCRFLTLANFRVLFMTNRTLEESLIFLA